MQTTSPIITDEPAIPEQYRHSIVDAYTFAAKAYRGACANRDMCKRNGNTHMLTSAERDVFETGELLGRLPKPVGHCIEFILNQATGEHELFIDGYLEYSHRRLDVCEIWLNEHLEHERTVARKNALSITPVALAATLADDDPIDIEAEYELMNASEKKPVKEPYVKNAWDKASAYFWVEVSHIVPKGKETAFTKRERLKALTKFFGRPITSTKQLSAEELTEAGQAIHDLYLGWDYERAAEKAA